MIEKDLDQFPMWRIMKNVISAYELNTKNVQAFYDIAKERDNEQVVQLANTYLDTIRDQYVLLKMGIKLASKKGYNKEAMELIQKMRIIPPVVQTYEEEKKMLEPPKIKKEQMEKMSMLFEECLHAHEETIQKMTELQEYSRDVGDKIGMHHGVVGLRIMDEIYMMLLVGWIRFSGTAHDFKIDIEESLLSKEVRAALNDMRRITAAE